MLWTKWFLLCIHFIRCLWWGWDKRVVLMTLESGLDLIRCTVAWCSVCVCVCVCVERREPCWTDEVAGRALYCMLPAESPFSSGSSAQHVSSWGCICCYFHKDMTWANHHHRHCTFCEPADTWHKSNVIEWMNVCMYHSAVLLILYHWIISTQSTLVDAAATAVVKMLHRFPVKVLGSIKLNMFLLQIISCLSNRYESNVMAECVSVSTFVESIFDCF